MPPAISEIVLVSNLQSTGPMFVSDTNETIAPEIGMLLAARLIITAGIGNTQANTHELFGPLPITEIQDRKLSCFLFSEEMYQKPIPGSSFSTGKGMLIYGVIFEDLNQDIIIPHKKVIQNVLNKGAGQIDFSETITGVISPEVIDTSKRVLNELLHDLNNALDLAEKYHGGSLFDLGFLVSLPDHLSALGKKLIQQPNGSREEEFSDKENIKILLSVGLVVREERDNEYWLIPQ